MSERLFVNCPICQRKIAAPCARDHYRAHVREGLEPEKFMWLPSPADDPAADYDKLIRSGWGIAMETDPGVVWGPLEPAAGEGEPQTERECRADETVTSPADDRPDLVNEGDGLG